MVVENLWDLRYKSPLCAAMLKRAREMGVQPLIDDHRGILDTLKSRDPKAARTAMREHLDGVIEKLLVATELDAMERARSEVAAKRSEIARRTSV
jgi:GntR family transcriptional repressor for pyruvate dehydrogenase complex